MSTCFKADLDAYLANQSTLTSVPEPSLFMDAHSQFQRLMKSFYVMRSNVSWTLESFTARTSVNGPRLHLEYPRRTSRSALSATFAASTSTSFDDPFPYPRFMKLAGLLKGLLSALLSISTWDFGPSRSTIHLKNFAQSFSRGANIAATSASRWASHAPRISTKRKCLRSSRTCRILLSIKMTFLS